MALAVHSGVATVRTLNPIESVLAPPRDMHLLV